MYRDTDPTAPRIGPAAASRLSRRAATLGRLLVVVLVAGSVVGASAGTALGQSAATPISYGETVSGELTTTDAQSSEYRGYHDRYAFNGSAGDVVTVDMASSGDTYLILLGPDGTEVARNDDSGFSLDSQIDHTLGESGEYTVVATSFSSGATFEYTLSLASGGTTADGTDLRSISYGESAAGEIDTGDPQSSSYRGYYEPVTFSGSAGDVVTVDMESSDDTYLFLLDPSGAELTRDDDGGFGLDSRIEAYALQQSGQYTIVATSFSSDATFEYTLSLSQGAATADDDRYEPNDALSSARSLSPGTYDDLQVVSQNDDYYAVALDSGEELTASIAFSDDVGDIDLAVYGPNADYLGDSTSVTDDESVTVTATETGTYYVHVYGWFGASAPYSLTLSTAQGPPLADLRSISYGETASGELDGNDPQSSAYRGYYEPVTFSGSAGDVVTVDMESSGDTYLFLLDPDGQEVARDDDGGSGLDSRIEQYTLGESGEYTIVATSFSSGATFAYTLSLTQVGGSGTSNLAFSAAGGASAVGDGDVTLQFTLENTGDGDRAAVVEVGTALENLPGEWTVASHSDAGATWRAAEGTWLFQSLAPGEPVTPSVTVTPPADASGTYVIPVRAFSSDDSVTATAVVTIQDGSTSLADAIDDNDNGRIDDAEVLAAIGYWESDEPVPGLGTPISNTQIIELTDLWSSGQEF